MRLSDALRLATTPRLAFSGAGGKTTALFRLGREYLDLSAHNSAYSLSTVFLAATTHLAVEQLPMADRHIVVDENGTVAPPPGGWPAGLLLFTGPLGQDRRTSGLSPAQMDQLFACSEQAQIPLLVEADGSRQRPLKAPASHEPAIPAWVDTVVVLAGLSGLGKPLNAEWVHRPERFSELAGLPLGQNMSAEALVRVLSHPSGGLQGIPEGARRIVLLNQADNPELQAAAQKMAPELLHSLSGGGDCFPGVPRGGQHPRGIRASRRGDPGRRRSQPLRTAQANAALAWAGPGLVCGSDGAARRACSGCGGHRARC